MSVYLGAGCPYSPKQIPSECNRAGAKVGLGDASLTVPSQVVGSLLQPGHLLSSGTAVQMQSVFCLLRIRKERRKCRPVVTSGPFSGAGILASGGGRVWCPVCLVLGSHRFCLVTVLAFGKEQRQVGSLGLGQWVSEVGAC